MKWTCCVMISWPYWVTWSDVFHCPYQQRSESCQLWCIRVVVSRPCLARYIQCSFICLPESSASEHSLIWCGKSYLACAVLPQTYERRNGDSQLNQVLVWYDFVCYLYTCFIREINETKRFIWLSWYLRWFYHFEQAAGHAVTFNVYSILLLCTCTCTNAGLTLPVWCIIDYSFYQLSEFLTKMNWFTWLHVQLSSELSSWANRGFTFYFMVQRDSGLTKPVHLSNVTNTNAKPR